MPCSFLPTRSFALVATLGLSASCLDLDEVTEFIESSALFALPADCLPAGRHYRRRYYHQLGTRCRKLSHVLKLAHVAQASPALHAQE